jgi:hypothetical protein
MASSMATRAQHLPRPREPWLWARCHDRPHSHRSAVPGTSTATAAAAHALVGRRQHCPLPASALACVGEGVDLGSAVPNCRRSETVLRRGAHEPTWSSTTHSRRSTPLGSRALSIATGTPKFGIAVTRRRHARRSSARHQHLVERHGRFVRGTATTSVGTAVRWKPAARMCQASICSLPTCRVDLDNSEFADQNARLSCLGGSRELSSSTGDGGLHHGWPRGFDRRFHAGGVFVFGAAVTSRTAQRQASRRPWAHAHRWRFGGCSCRPNR